MIALALAQWPNGAWDLGVSGGQLVMDETPATPMLVAIGSDRRAAPDDTLPDGRTNDVGPIYNARRGYPGDALDPNGQLFGCRNWLLEREKQTEDVRLNAISYTSEAMQTIEDSLGIAITVDAEWTARNQLEIVSAAGDVEQAVTMGVAA